MSLEQSVTLEDVFTVAVAKRVPMAPELAGYLSLEIADGADPGGGEVDPKTVFISEEGTVALVRPKDKPGSGDAEASVRSILGKLLDASGSSTPALTAAAKRKPVAGLPSLVEELEAALIPVNRAAGRRALARLARETKRVTMGVGRNATAGPPGKPTSNRPLPPSQPQPPRIQKVEKKKEEAPVSAPAPSAPLDVSTRGRSGSFSDEAVTAKRPNQLADVAAQVEVSLPKEEAKSDSPHDAMTRDPGKVESAPPPAAAAPSPRAPLPPPPARLAPPPPPQRTGPHEKVAPPAPPVRDANLFKGSEVDSLLASFEVSGGGEKEVSRDLKAIAGLDPTPPPPDARTLDDLTKDVGKGLPKISKPDAGDSVEALLALSEASGPLPTPAPIIPVPAVAAPPSQPISLAPPSPLVPSAMLGAPVPAAPVSQPRAPEPPFAAPPANQSSRNLPPENRSERNVSQPRDTGRRERVVEQVASTTSRQPKRAANEPRAPKTGLAMLVIALLVLGAGAGAIYKMNPAFFTGRKKPLPPPVEVDAGPAVPALTQCKVALVIQDAPANAEVLLRVGQGSFDVERMPVGARLEFVGTAEGFAPRRMIVRPETIWDKGTDGKPRTELPMGLDPSRAKPGQLDPWPAAEPGSQVGGSGSPGTVHVTAQPRGTEIWLLAGLGPEARIEQLKCDGDIDVLLAGQGTYRKRLHVPEKDIEATADTTPGNKVITVSAK